MTVTLLNPLAPASARDLRKPGDPGGSLTREELARAATVGGVTYLAAVRPAECALLH